MTFLNILIDAIAYGATFIYGSTGEILTEKSGHLNLGIPGIMCMGGAGGCLILNVIGCSSLPGFLIVIIGILCSFLSDFSFQHANLRKISERKSFLPQKSVYLHHPVFIFHKNRKNPHFSICRTFSPYKIQGEYFSS